jgi:hypothetical protein
MGCRWRWPQGVPYSFDAAPGIMEYVQNTTVGAVLASGPDRAANALFVIGYRGCALPPPIPPPPTHGYPTFRSLSHLYTCTVAH